MTACLVEFVFDLRIIVPEASAGSECGGKQLTSNSSFWLSDLIDEEESVLSTFLYLQSLVVDSTWDPGSCSLLAR